MPGTICRDEGERIRMFAVSARRARRRSAPAVRRRGAIEAPLRSPDLGGVSDGQPSQSPKGQEAAQDRGHQCSEGFPHHFGGSGGGARRISPVRIAGPEVSRDLSPHSGSCDLGDPRGIVGEREREEDVTACRFIR